MKEEAERFAAVAREFCDLVDTAVELEPADLRGRLVRILPKLYLAGLDLPFEAPDADFDHVDLQLDFVRLSKRLGEVDRYWEVYDPTEKTKPLEGSVALDLAEIRHDLQQGLLALERGEPIEAVVWEWRFGLENHWGNHLVDALRAIHWRRGW
jgi:hypothetical protein